MGEQGQDRRPASILDHSAARSRRTEFPHCGWSMTRPMVPVWAVPCGLQGLAYRIPRSAADLALTKGANDLPAPAAALAGSLGLLRGVAHNCRSACLADLWPRPGCGAAFQALMCPAFRHRAMAT